MALMLAEFVAGKTFILPTETSYGLCCDATNAEAVERIFTIKERKSDKPLLIILPTVAMAKQVLVWNDLLEKISTKYWPGPLTVVGTYKTPPFKEGNEGRSRTNGKRLLGFFRTIGLRSELRKNKTRAEKVLWSQLRSKQFANLRFRQQHGIGPYVVDFYQSDSKVVIEIDGDIHFSLAEQERKDLIRQSWLEEHGYTVLRFNNVDVFNNLDGVIQDIYHAVTVSRPHPVLPLKGEVLPLARGVVSLGGTVAVRVTADPFLASLVDKISRPIVATSGNISGTGDLYDDNDVISQFSGRSATPDYLFLAGVLPRRLPTTIVSVVHNTFTIIRQGEVVVTV